MIDEPRDYVRKDNPELEMSLSGGISNLDEVKFWIFTEQFPK